MYTWPAPSQILGALTVAVPILAVVALALAIAALWFAIEAYKRERRQRDLDTKNPWPFDVSYRGIVLDSQALFLPEMFRLRLTNWSSQPAYFDIFYRTPEDPQNRQRPQYVVALPKQSQLLEGWYVVVPPKTWLNVQTRLFQHAMPEKDRPATYELAVTEYYHREREVSYRWPDDLKVEPTTDPWDSFG
jgi:hypothetical protein